MTEHFVLTNTPRPGESAEQTAARSAPRGVADFDDVYVAEINGDIIKESASYDNREALKHIEKYLKTCNALMFSARLIRLSIPSRRQQLAA
jgi:hypothetical protein